MLLFVTDISIASEICSDTSATQELEKCLRQEVTKADARLNASYKSVLSALERAKKDNPGADESRKKLVAAQRAWIQFRDNDCDAIYALHIEGSLRGVLYLQCIIDHTNGRTDELDALMAY